MPRPYPPELRHRALDLVHLGRPVAEVAGLLGIAESCLYRWRRQDLVDRGLQPGTSQAESTELAAARHMPTVGRFNAGSAAPWSRSPINGSAAVPGGLPTFGRTNRDRESASPA
jgi:hypothetical protein